RQSTDLARGSARPSLIPRETGNSRTRPIGLPAWEFGWRGTPWSGWNTALAAGAGASQARRTRLGGPHAQQQVVCQPQRHGSRPAGLPLHGIGQRDREQRSFTRRQQQRGFAEMVTRRRLGPEDAGSPLGNVEIDLQDAPLGPQRFDHIGQRYFD